VLKYSVYFSGLYLLMFGNNKRGKAPEMLLMLIFPNLLPKITSTSQNRKIAGYFATLYQLIACTDIVGSKR